VSDVKVECVRVTASVIEAARVMHERAVGSLIVLDDSDRPVGILTDRDLLVRVLASQLDPAECGVADVMSSPLISVRPQDGFLEILDCMRKNGIRRIPVIEGDRIRGIVALDDLLVQIVETSVSVAEEVRTQFQVARRHAQVDRIRDELDHGFHELYEGLQKANWTAREVFLQEVDALRQTARRLLGGG
jgi:signal-transduction protein with cAMP-binding, CBS, and nucleotidyltransferase domain